MINNKALLGSQSKRAWQLTNRFKYTALITLCALLLIGGTLAVLTAMTNEVINPFTFGNIDIKIDEDFTPWVIKEVRLTNETGENAVPGIVRAKIVPVLVDEANPVDGRGENLGAIGAPTGTRLPLGDFIFVFYESFAGGDSANWFYKDGYFYYKSVLQPGQTTSVPLLQNVELGPDIDPEKYEGINFNVEVLAEIVQAEGNAPFDAWGVTVTNGTVSR